MNRRHPSTMCALAVAFLAAATGCQRVPATAQNKAAAAGRPPVPVRLAVAEVKDVPVQVEAIGNAEAYSSVALKSRVAGQVQKVHVQDGQDVKENDLLFELDAQPFAQQVRLAEANVARDRALQAQAEAAVLRDAALARNARSQSDRYHSLMQQGIIPREQADQVRSTAEAAEASLAANQAAIESARAALRADEVRVAQARQELGYTKIRAPIAGRAGFVNVREGNLIKENDTVALVSILRIQPVYVSFSVPEQTLPEIRRQLAAGHLAVEALAAGQTQPAAVGRLSSIDNTVDASTGTIRLKAEFANADRILWPGQFVNVRLRLSVERSVVTVPSKAVVNGARGPFVWIVKADRTVENRDLQVARTHAGVTVVAGGLAAGETVVTEGQLRLTKGARVVTAEASKGGGS